MKLTTIVQKKLHIHTECVNYKIVNNKNPPFVCGFTIWLVEEFALHGTIHFIVCVQT